MDDILQEYKDYYRVRADRYKENPNYKNSFVAESNLSDVMQSCNELIEFKDKMGDLNEKCANAYIKDTHLMEKAFYEKHKEVVRILAATRILEKIDDCKNATECGMLVVDEMNKNSLEISMDEWHREFQSDWKQMDQIEIYENAVVPSNYKSAMEKTASDIKARLIENLQSVEKEAQKFQPDFKLVPEKNKEHRHRRLIPYSDEHLDEQLAKYKSLLNR